MPTPACSRCSASRRASATSTSSGREALGRRDAVDRPIARHRRVSVRAGSQQVKDKEIHTAVGVAAWIPSFKGPQPNPAPFGTLDEVAYCTDCQHLAVGPKADEFCPVCLGASYRGTTLSQPEGFRTDFHPVDFDGSFEWAPRAIQPRLVTEDAPRATVHHGNAVADSWRGRIYTINDNAGQDFHFARDAYPFNGWVELDAAERARIPTEDPGQAEIMQVSLAAIAVTDAMLIGMKDVPTSFDLEPRRRQIGRFAAWISMGYLLRDGAARYLQIEKRELKVGLHEVRTLFGVDTRVFLADTLANGAGYCSHIGQPAIFPQYLGAVAAFAAELGGDHAAGCDGACYDCLREFYNMSFHPLLDWRLGVDLFTLLNGGNVDLGGWSSVDGAAARSFANSFQGNVATLDGGVLAVEAPEWALVVGHPFEITRPTDPAPRLAQAMANLEMRGYGAASGKPIHFASAYEMNRQPGSVAAVLYG